MKKILLAALVGLSLVSAPAFAHGPRHPSYGYGGYGIVIPTMIGGIIGYEIAKQPAPVVVQPQVITDPNLVIVNGVLYRKVMMQVNGTYQEVLVRP